MKFIPRDTLREEGGVIEYDGDPDINLARITLSGRYPEHGWALNTESKMLCYVVEGSGSLYFDDSSFELDAGDVCIIETNEKYYWDADMTLLIASTPAWTKKQTRTLE